MRLSTCVSGAKKRRVDLPVWVADGGKGGLWNAKLSLLSTWGPKLPWGQGKTRWMIGREHAVVSAKHFLQPKSEWWILHIPKRSEHMHMWHKQAMTGTLFLVNMCPNCLLAVVTSAHSNPRKKNAWFIQFIHWTLDEDCNTFTSLSKHTHTHACRLKLTDTQPFTTVPMINQ